MIFQRSWNIWIDTTLVGTAKLSRLSVVHSQTGPGRDPQQTAQVPMSILCECGSSYIGETAALCLFQYRHNLENKIWPYMGSWCRLERYQDSITEGISPYGFLNQSDQPITSNISPILYPLVSNEVSNSLRKLVRYGTFLMGINKVLFPSNFFTSQTALAVDI
jgi:hypothetical protein